MDAIDAPFEQPYSRFTTEDLLDFMSGFSLPPGALGTYNYSDVGYGMLGWALHDLFRSKETWESLTEARLPGRLRHAHAHAAPCVALTAARACRTSSRGRSASAPHGHT